MTNQNMFSGHKSDVYQLRKNYRVLNTCVHVLITYYQSFYSVYSSILSIVFQVPLFVHPSIINQFYYHPCTIFLYIHSFALHQSFHCSIVYIHSYILLSYINTFRLQSFLLPSINQSFYFSILPSSHSLIQSSVCHPLIFNPSCLQSILLSFHSSINSSIQLSM